MSEWISIEDQIPDEHEPVIISGWNFNNEEKGRYVEPAVRVGMDFWPPFERDEGLVKILIMEGRPFFPPTHWMPLPAAPGETAQPAAEQPYSTTSDKYRAELYDEVWSQARLIGFGNVTDALAELQRMKLADSPVPHKLLCELRAFTLEHDSGRAGSLRGNIDALLRNENKSVARTDAEQPNHVERNLNMAEQPDTATALTAAARDVLAERRRQVEAEGWTPEHDDSHESSGLAAAAGCYAMYTLAYPTGEPPPAWPWDKSWWKPGDERRNRVKAAALLLAEIERLDRALLGKEGE